MSTLAVAAGGGGDALGILALRGLAPFLDDIAGTATLAWERLRIDPVPGPRGRSGFVGLESAGLGTAEIVATTDTIPAGRSSLPRLAAESGTRLFLLDVEAGATGLTTQLHDLAHVLEVTEVVLVDIGGDVVAEGHEPDLLSPLADALTLQAVSQLDLPTRVLVAGPGLDGELSEPDVLRRIEILGGKLIGAVSEAAARPLLPHLAWHPSEVSALLTAAALGIRGSVELRRGDRPVPLSNNSPRVWQLATAESVTGNQIAEALRSNDSLTAAEHVTQRFGQSELSFERNKAAAGQTESAQELPGDLTQAVQAYAQDSLNREHDLITTRRLAEAIGVPGEATRVLIKHLTSVPRAASGPLWNLHALARARD